MDYKFSDNGVEREIEIYNRLIFLIEKDREVEENIDYSLKSGGSS